jgi:hypothetical protein
MSTGFNEGGDKEIFPQMVRMATNQLLEELSYINNISVVSPLNHYALKVHRLLPGLKSSTVTPR